MDEQNIAIAKQDAEDQLIKEAKEAAMLSKQDVDDAKMELQRIAQDNKDKFAQEIQELIDVEYEAAERVEILTPDVDIPCDIVLLDTPGFNTDLPAHRRRAWEAIEEMADVCILVSIYLVWTCASLPSWPLGLEGRPCSNSSEWSAHSH